MAPQRVSNTHFRVHQVQWQMLATACGHFSRKPSIRPLTGCGILHYLSLSLGGGNALKRGGPVPPGSTRTWSSAGGASGFRFNGMHGPRSKTRLTIGQGLLTSPALPRKTTNPRGAFPPLQYGTAKLECSSSVLLAKPNALEIL